MSNGNSIEYRNIVFFLVGVDEEPTAKTFRKLMIELRGYAFL